MAFLLNLPSSGYWDPGYHLPSMKKQQRSFKDIRRSKRRKNIYRKRISLPTADICIFSEPGTILRGMSMVMFALA
jgi:hypothetical protein